MNVTKQEAFKAKCTFQMGAEWGQKSAIWRKASESKKKSLGKYFIDASITNAICSFLLFSHIVYFPMQRRQEGRSEVLHWPLVFLQLVEREDAAGHRGQTQGEETAEGAVCACVCVCLRDCRRHVCVDVFINIARECERILKYNPSSVLIC